MKIGQILKESEGGFSFEFFPYKTDKGKERLREGVKKLKKYNHYPLNVHTYYNSNDWNHRQ